MHTRRYFLVVFGSISYIFKVVISHILTGQKRLRKIILGPVSGFLFILRIYPLSRTGKFLPVAEFKSRVRWKMERAIIQNKSQFNCVRKKESSKKKINIRKAEPRSYHH